MNALHRAVKTRFGFGRVPNSSFDLAALGDAVTKGPRMNQVSSAVKTFFRTFDRANNLFDAELLGPHLGDAFAEAGPSGGVQVVNKDELLANIKERQAHLGALGFRFVKVVPLEEISLSAHYALVKTHAVMRLERPPGRPVDLVHDAAYVLYLKGGPPKIVFALSHEDPLKTAQGLFTETCPSTSSTAHPHS